MEWAPGRAFVVVATVVAGLVVFAPAATAATRYAEPGVGGSDPLCPQADPCNLQEAVESAGATDEVIVTAGTYVETDVVAVPAGVNVHGAAGAMPVITSSDVNEAVNAIAGGGTSRVADLTIVHTLSNTGLRIQNGNLGERLYVRSAGTTGCNVLGAVLRDSVCWSTGFSGNGVVNNNTTGIPITTTLRNVTAVASGTGSDGIEIRPGTTQNQTLDAKNVIADGTAFDVRADTQTGTATATINLSNSNYATTQAGDGPGTEFVTPAGSGNNQTSAPGFVNAAAGDFHQTANSVTIDAGAADPLLGSQDPDGEPRSQGPAPDIGADEFTAGQTPPPNGDNFPPDTGIRKGPKRKTPKRKAKFEFGGSEPGVTFECRLDVGSRQGTYESCTSPLKIRGLRRNTKYVFTVRAVDGAGNPDPSPADRRWKVTKKNKG